MITGQNGYAFSNTVDFKSLSAILLQSSEAIVSYFKVRN